MAAFEQPTQWIGVGRRKSATARVYLRPGTGKIIINKREFEEYFPRATARMDIVRPLELAEKFGELDVVVNVRGGGLTGQAGAVRHGITRALLEQALLHELVHRRALGCVHERPLEQDQAALGEDLE